MITVFDLETTGLLKSEGNPLSVQPHIIEIYACQVDEDGEIQNELETYVKPPVSIPNKITKITGIRDEHVANAPTFAEVYRKVVNVFFKSHTVVSHNLSFDEGMLINELRRLGKQYHFPYPPIKFCTVEQSLHLKGYRLKNGELYEMATGEKIEGAHRAKNDVIATYKSYKWLKGKDGLAKSAK